ncbi:MAG: HlyD family type I secretion periplasmic adaptor subunit [Hyphomicrobiaceae bacterium]
MARSSQSWHAPLDKSIRKPAIIGIALFTLLFGGFGVWASTAPLASAVIARGTFVATGQNKVVQHLEGGIISRILVKEGELVEAGQPLVEMDQTAARATVRRLEIKRAMLAATMARIDAEREGAEVISWPEDLERAKADTEIGKIIAAQESLFKARREEFLAKARITERQIKASEEQIGGLEAQRAATNEQLRLIVEETAASEALFQKGLTEMSRLLALKRSKAKLEGDIGDLTSQIGQVRQAILKSESELAHLRSQFVETAVELYRQSSSDRLDAEEALNAARDILRRTVVTAPARGVIVKLYYYTKGAVVGSGQAILEILPTDERLLVEAQVRPQDIDSVHAGMMAEVNLSALNHRTTPVLVGEVTYVSADKLETKQPGEYVYLARIELPQSELDKLGTQKVAPGMPAEIFVKTGERTLFEYVTRPIHDMVLHGAREQ